MPGHISEGIRYFRIAQNHCNLIEENGENAFVSFVFSAMYVESVVNEVIFTDQLLARMYEEALGKPTQSIELNIDEPHSLLGCKIPLILDRYNVTDYNQDNEYIALKHLIALRNGLVHLTPMEQGPEGKPKAKTCPAALNYLRRSLNIIDAPFSIGVYWTDVLMRKEVADWAVSVAKNSIGWLYRKTYSKPFGDQTLQWHCQLLDIEIRNG